MEHDIRCKQRLQNFTQALQHLKRATKIEEVIIYGSRAKGNYREGSDIDIILKGERVTEEICSQLWLDIDALNMPYLIDLSVYHLFSTLIEHINRIGKTFYKKEEHNIAL